MTFSNAILAVILSVCVMPVLLLLASLLERRSHLRSLSTAPMGANANNEPLPAHTACRIYSHVEREHDGRDWGRVLDAGTGCGFRLWRAHVGTRLRLTHAAVRTRSRGWRH